MSTMVKTPQCTLSAVTCNNGKGIALGRYFSISDENNPIRSEEGAVLPGTLFMCKLVYDEEKKKNVLTIFPHACRNYDIEIVMDDRDKT